MLVLAFMFSLVALAVVAVLGLALGGWLWWKTRALRKQIRTSCGKPGTADMAGGGKDIIEEWENVSAKPAPERSAAALIGQLQD